MFRYVLLSVKYFQIYKPWFLLIIAISLGNFSYGSSSINTRSQFQLYQEEINPWIGSHIINFSPNPFLNPNSRQQKSPKEFNNPDASNYILIASTAESPLSPTSTEFPPKLNNQELLGEVIVGKRKIRRKVKGRRRLPARKKNSRGHKYKESSHTRNDIGGAKSRLKLKNRRKPRVKIYVVPKSRKKKRQEENPEVNTLVENDFNKGKIKFLPIDKVSRNPAFMTKSLQPTTSNHFTLPITTELPIITTPSPIKVEIDPHSNQIQIDYTTHPENLNPEYFQNVIMKAMMEKLMDAGIVTESPISSNVPVPSEKISKGHKISKRQ